MDRKYSHRGYRDSDKEKKSRPERKPPQGGPRGQNDHLGPRTPRMVGTVTRARCANCGAVLAPGFDASSTCPKCNAELHCCKQCRFFDSGAQFECTQPIPADRRRSSRANSRPSARRPPGLRKPFQEVAHYIPSQRRPSEHRRIFVHHL